MSNPDYSLYLATDPAYLVSREVAAFGSVLDSCLAQGVTLFQLRLKETPIRIACELGERVREITRRARVPLIINDRVDLALALEADGVHVGRDDLPPATVRRLLPDGIIGYSVNTLAHLEYAQAAGVDYVGVGPVFGTQTKADTGAVLGLAGLRRIINRAELPCVGIGGITAATAGEVIRAGASGVCVVAAVFKAAEPAAAAGDLRKRIDAAFQKNRTNG